MVAVVGRGRRMPERTFATMVDRITDADAPWYAEAELVPLGLCTQVAGPFGLQSTDEASFVAECPLAPELLSASPN